MTLLRMLRSRMRFALGVLLLASHGFTVAQEASVRAGLNEAAEPVWVGQPLQLTVELLAPGYFASAASFDLPDPDGVLLMPPTSHPLVSSETVDGTSYTIQRHELAVWPMRAGDQLLPPITIRFSFKRNALDSDEVQASVTTSPLAYSVQVPPGAEDLGTVISARDLDIEESWDSEPGSDEIPAGAAFKRTITFSAPDVPGMVFPPFPADPIDGLGIYSKQQILDESQRGVTTGKRQQVITYICERPGQFVIPAVRFSWFDIDAGELRSREFAARTLNVIANPAMAAADSSGLPAAGNNTQWLTIITVVLAVLLAGYFAARSRRARQVLERSIAPFRPVHLLSLNPSILSVEAKEPAREKE
jgi:LPXTG-motif cell wall-anchored protein